MAGETRPRPISQNARCDRARQWSSLRLDSELSELEDAMLERHLEICGECLAFEAQLRSTAEALRTAPPVPPGRRFEFPSRREVRFPVGRRLAVAATAAALALGSLVGSTLQRPAARPDKPAPQVSFLTRDLSQLRQIPRGQQVQPLAPTREPGGPPEGII